jgi:hypothetical protein
MKLAEVWVSYFGLYFTFRVSELEVTYLEIFTQNMHISEYNLIKYDIKTYKVGNKQ